MSLIEEEKINSEKYKLLEEIIEYNNKKVKIVKLTIIHREPLGN